MSENRVTNERVVHSALWSALATSISVPVLIVSTVLVARILGVGDYGRFALYGYLIVLLGGLGDLGVGTALLRSGAVAAGRGDDAALMRYVRAGTTWSLLQIPWALFVGWLILPTRGAQVVFGIAVIASLSLLGPSHYLVMTSSLKRASQVKLISLVLNTAGLLIAAKVTHSPAMTFAAGTLGMNVLTVAQIYALPRGRRVESLRPGRLVLTRADFGFGLGSLLNSQLNGFVFSRSEVLFFGKSQARERGTFASSQTISARSTVLIDVFLGVTPTALSSAAGRGVETTRRAFIRLGEAVRLLLIATAPLLAVAVVTLAPIAFGDGFDGLAGPALVLTIASLFQSGMNPVLALRYAQRSIMPMIVAGLLAAAVDAALAATLIRHIGVWGAVLANAAAGVVYLVAGSWTYLRDEQQREMVLGHMLRLTWPLAGAAAIAAPLIALPDVAAIAIGLPVAAIASLVMMRVPGIRMSQDGRDALVQALPARVREPVASVLDRVSGRVTSGSA